MATVNLMDDDDGPRGARAGGVLPEGTHLVRVEKVLKESKTPTGTPFVEYLLSNAQGSIKKTFYITPAAKFRLKNFAVACGYDGSLREFDFRNILGMTVQVVVGKEPNKKDGKLYNEVVDWAAVRRQVPVNSVGNLVDDDDAPF